MNAPDPLKAKVLILDDDPSITELLSTVMKEEGYDTMASNSPKDVVFLSRQFRPDVLILDLMMPELDGYEVCAFFKRDPELTHTRIIILTARDNREARLKAYQVKADLFMAKPFEMVELRQVVRNQAEAKLAQDRIVQDLVSQTLMDRDTSAYNRKFVERRITEELKRIDRARKQLGFVLVHIDLYKYVCVHYGFAFGKEIMRTIAEAIRRELREFDMLARFNEDTFLVVLPDSSTYAIKAVTTRIRTVVSSMVFMKKKNLAIHPLLVATAAEKGTKLEEVLQNLDRQFQGFKAGRPVS